MDSIDYQAIVATQSARFADVLAGTALDTPVPSRPDWTAADLAWHLAEVQHFWSAIVGDLLDDPELAPNSPVPTTRSWWTSNVARPTRPSCTASMPSSRLVSR